MEQPSVQIKCRKCRTIITKVSAKNLLDAHFETFSRIPTQIESDCQTIVGRTEVYLNEDTLEPWIQKEIEKSEWTKGKLKCIKCTANVGSFDFVAGQKCDCKEYNSPAVHFIQSKIDLEDIK